MRTTAKVTMTMTVEVSIPDTWGGDCTADGIFEAALTEAENTLRLALGPDTGLNPKYLADVRARIRVVGTAVPSITLKPAKDK